VTDCPSDPVSFPACRGRRVAAGFDGGAVTSDGGVLPLRQADRRRGLTAATAWRPRDPRQRGKRRHSVVDMVLQRVFGIAPGYEDLNDHADLRHDPGLQTAPRRDRAQAIHAVLVARFPRSPKGFFQGPPEEIVLDMDATDDAVPGPRATAGGPTRSACTLLDIIRRLSLKGTRMARAPCATIPPEDRCRDHPQYPAGALPPVVGLSRAGPLPSGRRTAHTPPEEDPGPPRRAPVAFPEATHAFDANANTINPLRTTIAQTSGWGRRIRTPRTEFFVRKRAETGIGPSA